MVSIFDYAEGFALIEVRGACPEEALNRCADACLSFWSVEMRDEFCLRLRCRLSDAGAICALADKCGCDMELVSRRGTPVAVEKLKGRSVLWVSSLLLLLALAVSSLFVWRVDIIGNGTVSETRIRNALSECGVGLGSFWPGYNAELIRTALLLELPELKWAGVSVYGSRVVVQVRQASEIPELFDPDEPVSVVAARAGIIKRLDALRGYALLWDGDTAAEGDTIIDGVVPSEREGDTRVVHASGTVLAHTWYELSAVMPMEYAEKIPTGKGSTQLALLWNGRRINIFGSSRILDGDCDIIIKEYNLGIEGLFSLPISLETRSSEQYETVQTGYTEAELRESLTAALEKELLKHIGETGEVAQKSISFSQTQGYAVGTLRAQCLQNIAEPEAIPLSEVENALRDGKEENIQ